MGTAVNLPSLAETFWLCLSAYSKENLKFWFAKSRSSIVGDGGQQIMAVGTHCKFTPIDMSEDAEKVSKMGEE